MRCLLIAGSVALVLACPDMARSAEALADQPLWEFLETNAAPEAAAPSAAFDHLLLAKSYGPSGPPGNGGSNGAALSSPEYSEAELGSFGCIIGGALGTAGAIALGGQNVINLIAGGVVLPASPAALYASLFGVVFASFCAVGQAMTPAVMHAYRRYFEETETIMPQPGVPQPAPLLGRIHHTVYRLPAPDER